MTKGQAFIAIALFIFATPIAAILYVVVLEMHARRQAEAALAAAVVDMAWELETRKEIEEEG